MEELTENAEEPDEGESKAAEAQKLGKLQYKVCDLFLSLLFLLLNFILIN